MNNVLRPMKVIAFLLFTTVLACSKPEMVGEQPDVQSGPDVTLEVTLDVPTKTTLGEKTGNYYPVLWSEGDCISVNGRGSSALTASQAGKTTASFKVTGVSAPYNVVYPVTAMFSDGVVLPKSQKFTEWGFDPSTAIQVGKSSSLSPDLHNVCAYLRITIGKSDAEVVKQIKVISNDGKFLCGRFSIDYENNKLDYIEAGMNCVVMGRPEDDNTVSIPYNEDGTCTAFIAIPSGTYPKGFTVVVSTVAGDNMVKRAFTKGVVMASGSVHPLEEVSFGDNAYRFSGGTGTAEDPYIIATSDDISSLFSFSNHESYSVNYYNKHYKQICDISVENQFWVSAFREPSKAFAGVYDGGGHMIEYLSVKNHVSGDTAYACGLFAYTKNAVIRNLNIRYKFYRDNPKTITGNYNGGFIGHMDGGLIENCHLSGNMHSGAEAAYVGGIVGYLDGGGVVSGCVVSSSVSADGAVAESSYNNSHCGGVVGYVNDGTVKDCVLSGHVRSVGSCAGGIVGSLVQGEISGCNVDRAYIYGDVARVGGIAGYVGGAGCKIENCEMTGIVLSKTAGEVGGIAGYMRGGQIVSCQVLKPATVSGEGGSVGGVAGNVYSSVTSNDVLIDNCTVFADVTGKMNVGGIAGTVNSQGGSMRIINNAYAHGTVTTTGHSNNAANMGGIVGLVTGTGTVAANVLNNACMMTKFSNTASADDISSIGGIVGAFLGPGALSWCWSDVMIGNITTNSATTSKLGSIVGDCALSTLPHCYYDSNSTIKATQTKSGLGTAISSFTDGTMLSRLNWTTGKEDDQKAWVNTVWTLGGTAYPTPQGIASNEGQRTKKTKRISVIGDSISSFDGYNPEGYDAYYPTTTCRTFCVRDMYWYRLAYDYMQDAILDVNIAFSGSLVTYNGNWKNFPSRYILRKGMGNPDIILLWGGTNDYTANKILYGSTTCQEATSAPSTSDLGAVFATVDAATTMDKAEALSDLTFFEAYIKLVKMMTLQYPEVKIVLIIGEHFSVGMKETIEAIAEHYPNNCRTVDLLSINGFDGITTNPDWRPIGKCMDGARNLHPNEAGMEFIANKIYTELGGWLEE